MRNKAKAYLKQATWVIRVQRRKEYMAALEQASVEGKIGSFASFIAEEMKESFYLPASSIHVD